MKSSSYIKLSFIDLTANVMMRASFELFQIAFITVCTQFPHKLIYGTQLSGEQTMFSCIFYYFCNWYYYYSSISLDQSVYN